VLKLGTWESRQKLSGEFELWCGRRTDRVKIEEALHSVKEERSNQHTIKLSNFNSIENVWHWNCLVRRVIEVQIQIGEDEEEEARSYWMLSGKIEILKSETGSIRSYSLKKSLGKKL
jgi:hypothetical protein